MAATLLAQLSDPHVQAEGGDPAAAQRLQDAVRSVLSLRPQPDAVLVSGDLAEHGRPTEYARVGELLAPLPMPVHVLAGNHDDRGAMDDAFELPDAVAVGDGLRLVLVDTTIPGRDHGALGSERLARLAETLAAETQAPTIVAMHHPPLLTGIGPLDAIGLSPEDRAAFGTVVGAAPQVRRVVAGHVHRGAFAMLGTVPVFSCPSTYLQGRLEIGSGELELVYEPPAFALHVLLDGELVTHVQPVEVS